MQDNLLHLIKRMSLFILPLAFLCIVFEYKLSQIPTSYSIKKATILKHQPNIETLILGSSQSLKGIDAKEIPNAYNLANVSQTLYYDKALLEYYLPQLPRLKTVVLNISYFTLWEELCDSESFRDYFYNQAYGFQHPSISRWDSRYWSNIMRYGPRESLKMAIKGFELPYSLDIDSLGCQLLDSLAEKEISEESGKARIAVHESAMLEKNLKTNIANLEGILTLLKAKGIKPILLTTPTYSTYRKYEKRKFKTINSKVIDSLANRYKFIRLDLEADPCFTIQDFADNDHLNARGARKLGRMVGNNDSINQRLSRTIN